MIGTNKVPDKDAFCVWILWCLVGWRLRLALLAGEGLTRLHFYLDSQGSCGQSAIFFFLAAPLCLLAFIELPEILRF